jgi:hypothetical protein
MNVACGSSRNVEPTSSTTSHLEGGDDDDVIATDVTGDVTNNDPQNDSVAQDGVAREDTSGQDDVGGQGADVTGSSAASAGIGGQGGASSECDPGWCHSSGMERCFPSGACMGTHLCSNGAWLDWHTPEYTQNCE